MKKSQIRKIILKKRNNLNFKNKKFNFSNLLKLLSYKSKNKKIGLYYPIGSEVSTIELIKYLRKKKYIISLPVLEKNFVMSFYEWNNKSPLKINNYGIPEPVKLKKIIPSILIIPIVAFDTELNRLGYGGGFYDRTIAYLEKRKKITTIGIGFHDQKIDDLPRMKFDKKLDLVITENGVQN